MAEAAAAALLSVIFEKLTDEAFKKFARSQKIHSELNELQNTLSQIQAVLNDASDKEFNENSVKQWLNRLQHLAYDIDDVLDDVATQAMHRELSQESEAITSKVRNLIVPTCCTKLSLSQSLTSMRIVNCQSMESFSDLQLSNLTRLYIEECESIESFPNLQLPNLTELDIIRCKNMKEFGDLHIPNLISWKIEECKNLESFPDLQLSKLSMLKEVHIINCPMIDARGHWPPNLSTLQIGGLKKPISEWGYQNFPASLVKLALLGAHQPDVRNFSHLSELLPSSLTSLAIKEFDNIESLLIGLQHLTSLQHLIISECPKLINLPETLLPSLLSLWIEECHRLKERCDGGGSHYWPRISHIPKIIIDLEFPSNRLSQPSKSSCFCSH